MSQLQQKFQGLLRTVSGKAVLLIAILLWATQFYFSFPVYSNGGNLFAWDIFGYYCYLPFNFIYHDPGLTNQAVIDSLFLKYQPSDVLYQAFTLPNGNKMPGYSIGMAVLYFPFFILAHIWALAGNFPADGFSYPYQFCVSNGVMLYIIAGLFFLRKVLLHFFSDAVSAIVLLLVCLGTNYWQEVIHGSLGVHPVLFSGYALLCCLILEWYQRPNFKSSFLLGCTGGLMAEIRGSEVLLSILVLLWNVSTWLEFKRRILFLFIRFRLVLVVLAGALIIFVPQFLHWHYVSGNWYFSNYQTAEGFNFLRPNLFNIFFSFKKSLFIYTPIMIFAFLGFIFLYRRNRKIFYPLFIFILLNTYLLSCWLLWWNATSFGLRYFVQSYALMSLPLAAFTAQILMSGKFVRYFFAALAIFLVFLNQFQTWQTHTKVLHPERNTFEYYKAVFLQTKVPDGALSLLEPDRNTKVNGKNFDEAQFTKRLIGYCDFEYVNTININPVFQDSNVWLSSPYSCRLDSIHPFSPTYRFPYNFITVKAFAWLRISLRYYCNADIAADELLVVAHCELDGTGRKVDKYESFDVASRTSIKGKWNTFTCEYQLPYRFYDEQPVLVYVWHRGKTPVYIDNFMLEAFEPKSVISNQ